jgi:predicted nucleotidyltransferase
MRATATPETESPEARIALLCARPALTPAQSARLAALLAGGVDGARLIAIAERHGLIPLVRHHLAGVGDVVPAPLREELHARARTVAARSLMMLSELVRVAQRLESRGIPVVPYKGPLLALTAYGSVGLRAFDDLDLLIAREHVRDAARILLDDGFRPVYELTAGQETAYLRTQCEYIVERDDLRVELHWEIVPRYFSWPLDPAPLLARAMPASVGGVTLRTLAPEDLLLVLCAHASKHCWDRMEWVASFAQVVRRHPALEWPELRRRVERAGARRMFDTSLALVRDVMDVDLPASVSADVDRDPVAVALARDVGGRLLSGDPGFLDRAQEVSFHVRSRERRRDRLRYVARLGTTQTLGDWDLVRLPRGVDQLYRLIRPLRLLGKFGAPTVARSLRAIAAGTPPGRPPRRERRSPR